jgi:hypothetical protein
LGEQPGNIHKNTPCNNFSTAQPIFTNSEMFDSTQQAELNKSIKCSQNFILGEQTGIFKQKYHEYALFKR